MTPSAAPVPQRIRHLRAAVLLLLLVLLATSLYAYRQQVQLRHLTAALRQSNRDMPLRSLMYRNQTYDREYIEYLEKKLWKHSPHETIRARAWNTGNRALVD